MKKSRIAFVFTLVPAIVAAQSATATTSTTAEAAAKAGRTSVAGNAQAASATNIDVPSSYSAASQARLNATFERARERKLPEDIATTRADNGVWYVDLDLPPGEYRYAFRVDGKEWRVPEGVAAVDDEFGGKSAWLKVSRPASK